MEEEGERKNMDRSEIILVGRENENFLISLCGKMK